MHVGHFSSKSNLVVCIAMLNFLADTIVALDRVQHNDML